MSRGKLWWDKFFLGLAEHISRASKDPSTKAGAVVVDKNGRIVSMGYNGFARGVKDHKKRYNHRPTKYAMVVHCEMNAILFAQRDLTGCTLYTYPFQSCSNCAKHVVQSGIKRCVAPPISKELMKRWGDDTKIAQQMFKESKVKLEIVKI